MTDAPPTADGLTRHLFAFGSGSYPADPYLPDLPGVAGDLHRIGDLFGDLGYRPILTELRDAPDARQVLAGLEDWLQDPARTETDVLTVYYAGHGLRETHHRLTCRTSRQDRQTSTIRTSELAELLAGSPVGHALLILDTCYAELGAAGITKAAADLVDVRPPDADGLWLLASARARGIAHDHAFVDGLERAVRNGAAGMRPRYLDVATITTRINAHFSDHRPDQRATYHAASGQTVPPFFPNREHRPGLPEHPVDVESAREWTAHFDPRGRGVEYASEKGDHFTGRRQALATLAGWLREPRHDARARVVTGDPGSGKSAVLGRLLALSREDRPEAPAHLLPPRGCVTTAVHAHGTTLEQLTSRLATALAVDADSPSELLAALAAPAAPADATELRTILIDALDEAGTGVGGREPQRIARELLRPMSALPHLRLIIGTRRSGIPDLGRAVEIIDLDTDAYTGREDVEAYAADTLPPSPHRAELARAVAARAGRSFLVARMTVRALTLGDLTVDVTRPGWESHLPSEVGEAFDAYLARYGDDEPKVRRLLRPLAHAEGAGLPWDSLWAPLATALSGVPCTDDDIDWLLRNAGSYVLEVPVDQGRSVFRLYHEALAEHLRDPRRSAEDQRRMTAALLASFQDWPRAHPYVLSHIPAHAAASDDLERLLRDPFFLVHADPDALLAALESVRSPEAVRVRAMYRTSAHLYRTVDVTTRAQILAVDAARYQAEEYRVALSERLEWRPRWATGSQTSPRFHAELTRGSVRADILASARLSGRDVLLVVDDWSTVSVWDPTDRSLLGGLKGAMAVSALASTVADGVSFVVTGSLDGCVRVWDLASRTELLCADAGSPVWSLACTRLNGRAVFVGRGPGAVWVRDLLTGELHSTLPASCLEDEEPREYGLACAGTEKEATVLINLRNSLLRWRPSDGLWEQLPVKLAHPVVAATAHRGMLLAAFATQVGEVEICNLDTFVPLTALSVEPQRVSGLAFADVCGRKVLLVGCMSGSVLLVDAEDGHRLGWLNGHNESVYTVAALTVSGAPFVATGSEDESVRLWNLAAEDETWYRGGHNGNASEVSCSVVDGEPVAVTGGADQVLRVWELATGKESARLSGHRGAVISVDCVVVEGRPVAVSAAVDRSVRVWDLTGAGRGGGWDDVGNEPVSCVVVDARPVALVGPGSEHPAPESLELRDLATGVCRGRIAPSSARGEALATAVWAGVPVLALAVRRNGEVDDHDVQLWDLARCQELATFPVGGAIMELAWGFDGRRAFVVIGTDCGAGIWDARTGRFLHHLETEDVLVFDVRCAVMDGVAVAVTCTEGGVRIWELATGRLMHRLALPVPAYGAAVAPGGELVVCAGFEVIVFERSP
ncbi:caspase family protein [Streptomyces sp. NPDC089799]|uniref:caspase family protein n=1 Tax=Streptomyces sp. NPDC089799 TaxID=3155066 RepID=UPI003441985E